MNEISCWLNLDEIEWAVRYLSKKLGFQYVNSNTNYSSSNYNEVNSILNNIKELSFRKLVIKEMQAALRQKRYRNKSGNRSYNFIMSKNIQKDLIKLANLANKPINKALEALITSQLRFNQEVAAKIRSEQKESRIPKLIGVHRALKIENSELKNYKKQASEMIIKYQKSIDQLIEAKCQYEIILNRFNDVDMDFTEEEKSDFENLNSSMNESFYALLK